MTRRTIAAGWLKLASGWGSYQSRAGEEFAFAAELEMKREQLAEIDADLASDTDDTCDGNVQPPGRVAA
jgi:hypothetical protein